MFHAPRFFVLLESDVKYLVHQAAVHKNAERMRMQIAVYILCLLTEEIDSDQEHKTENHSLPE